MRINSFRRAALLRLTCLCLALPLFSPLAPGHALSVAPPPAPTDPPPVSTSSAKVTGGGSIALPTDNGTFGFVAKTSSAGTPQGNLVYQDHATGRTVKSLQITGLIVDGTHARFWGKAMIDDDGEHNFVVDVDDFAEPGAGMDTFSIQTDDGYSVAGTILAGGNIQVHK